MLTPDIITKIEQFVHEKPRSIQEISEFLDKNWRTADRYIDEIVENYGTISTRIFRGGTRGALKIVFWAGIDSANKSIFQQELETQIAAGKVKDDFYPFDIYQYVNEEDKYVEVSEKSKDPIIDKKQVEKIHNDFGDLLLKAKKQIISFSGDLSFVNMPYTKGNAKNNLNKSAKIIDVLDEIAAKGISIKIICRVDVVGKENIEKLLSINHKYGKEIIEIKHRRHPLRGMIIDNQIFRLKEIRYATGKEGELKNDTYYYYHVTSKDWVDWLTKVFWKMHSTSISAKKRLDEINKLNIKK